MTTTPIGQPPTTSPIVIQRLTTWENEHIAQSTALAGRLVAIEMPLRVGEPLSLVKMMSEQETLFRHALGQLARSEGNPVALEVFNVLRGVPEKKSWTTKMLPVERRFLSGTIESGGETYNIVKVELYVQERIPPDTQEAKAWTTGLVFYYSTPGSSLKRGFIARTYDPKSLKSTKPKDSPEEKRKLAIHLGRHEMQSEILRLLQIGDNTSIYLLWQDLTSREARNVVYNTKRSLGAGRDPEVSLDVREEFLVLQLAENPEDAGKAPIKTLEGLNDIELLELVRARLYWEGFKVASINNGTKRTRRS